MQERNFLAYRAEKSFQVTYKPGERAARTLTWGMENRVSERISHLCLSLLILHAGLTLCYFIQAFTTVRDHYYQESQLSCYSGKGKLLALYPDGNPWEEFCLAML